MTRTAQLDKFRRNCETAARPIAPEAAERVIAAVARLESLPDVTALVDDLVKSNQLDSELSALGPRTNLTTTTSILPQTRQIGRLFHLSLPAQEFVRDLPRLFHRTYNTILRNVAKNTERIEGFGD